MRKKIPHKMIFVENATSHNHNLKLGNVECKFLPQTLQPSCIQGHVPKTYDKTLTYSD